MEKKAQELVRIMKRKHNQNKGSWFTATSEDADIDRLFKKCFGKSEWR